MQEIKLRNRNEITRSLAELGIDIKKKVARSGFESLKGIEALLMYTITNADYFSVTADRNTPPKDADKFMIQLETFINTSLEGRASVFETSSVPQVLGYGVYVNNYVSNNSANFKYIYGISQLLLPKHMIDELGDISRKSITEVIANLDVETIQSLVGIEGQVPTIYEVTIRTNEESREFATDKFACYATDGQILIIFPVDEMNETSELRGAHINLKTGEKKFIESQMELLGTLKLIL
ncbi:MAG: hypothetical protein ATN35_04770 [Epulopiscium sp. Nele67-Bin004]|nr:MAG: hypothetical protein ATN35_04770 [Epulopiscium sp. Nele67-Bin004]